MRIFMLTLFFTASIFASSMSESILKNVLVVNAKSFVDASEKMKKDLSKKTTLKELREDFVTLVYIWKKVEASYIAGELNDDFIDTARMIDVYHQGNEDITKQLDIIRKSKEDLNTQLYKNSHKSINALEYMLYSSEKLSKRDIAMLKMMIDGINSHAKDIYNVYKNDTKKFLNDETFANGLILNTLIDSAYKAKQWRLGEALAKEKKFKTKDSSRLEYIASKNSLLSLKAIVQLHREILDAHYEDFGDMALKSGARKEMREVRETLASIKTLLSTMKQEDLMKQKGEKAYELFNSLYINYALHLITSLEITAKIIEADGD